MYKEQVVLEGFDEQIRKLENFSQISRKHERLAMFSSVSTVLASVRPLAPSYRSRLRQSLGSEVKELAGVIEGHVGSSLVDEVYPKVMEVGRQPGSVPPLAGLMRWVHLVLGVPADRAQKVAMAVAFSIARKGIKGRLFMKQGWTQSKPAVENHFKVAMNRIVDELVVK